MFVGIGMLWAVVPLINSKFAAARLKHTKSSLLGETKEIIKDRIDDTENLNEDDLERLISMIRLLIGKYS